MILPIILLNFWHSVLNEKILNKSGVESTDNVIYTLFYKVLPYYENNDGACNGHTSKLDLTQPSKANKNIVNTLTMEKIEKGVEIKGSKILVQSSTQKDVFYEIEKNGNADLCNCKNHQQIKPCTHVYIVSRIFSVHPLQRMSNKRKAETIETINKLQKIALVINNATHESQEQIIPPEYQVDLTEDDSFPATSLNYNYASANKDSQVVPPP